MEAILNHKTLPSFSLNSFTPVGEIVWCEGVLLSLWRENASGRYYFVDWVSLKGDDNVWLLYPMTENELRQYFGGKLSRSKLLKTKQAEIQVLFANSDWNIHLAEPAPSVFPENWLPKGEDFFDPADCPDVSKFSRFMLVAG